jgi:DNA-binding MarR family transcriptional regulator
MNAVRSVVRALRINTRAIESKMGISLAQLFVLQQLADRPASSLNELADRTATHQSSVSVVVRRLVDSGYVSRTTSAHDKRRIEIDVTPTGRGLLADAPSTIQLQLMTFAASNECQRSDDCSRTFSSAGCGTRTSTSRRRRCLGRRMRSAGDGASL